MSTAIGSLSVLLNLKTGAFTGGLRRASGSVQHFSGQLQQVQRVAGGISSKLLALVGVGGGIAGFSVGIAKASARIDSLAKSSDKLGMSTEKLAAFQHAAELTGVSSQQATTAMQRMVRRIAEAAQGTGEAKKALTELGLSATALNQLAPDRQFSLIADAMNKTGNQADRVRLSMRLFDTEGVALVNTLRLGSEGLEAMSTEADKLGISFSRVDAAKVEMANDAMARLKSVFSGVFNQLSIKLAPVIDDIATSLTDAATSGDGLGATIGNVVDYGVKGVGFLADSWQGLELVFKALQSGASWAMGVVLDKLDGLVRGFQWLAELGRRLSDFMGAMWDHPKESMQVATAVIKHGFATMVQFVSLKIADLLNNSSYALYHIKGMSDVADSMGDAAGKLRTSTQAMVTDTGRELDAVAKAAEKATGVDFTGMTAPIETQGLPALTNYRDAMGEIHEANLKELEDLRNKRLNSDLVWEAYERLKQQAEEKAQQTAAAAPGATIPTGDDTEDPAVVAERNRQKNLEILAQQHQTTLSGIYQQGLKEREQFANKSAWAQTKQVLSALMSATSQAAKHSKTMFRIHKLASIGNAVISTAEGVSRALGAYPPPLNFAMAGLVAASGAMQIASIKNTQYGGGASAPSVSASIPTSTATTNNNNTDDSASHTSSQDTTNNAIQQTLLIQGDVIRAEELERISQEARERNIQITEIRRA